MADYSSTTNVYFSNKQAEEVGFDKFAARQKRLQGIRILSLDGMRLRHVLADDSVEADEVRTFCAGITDLDVSGNLFESFEEVERLCALLPALQSLVLDRNRFGIGGSGGCASLTGLRAISLSGILLTAEEVSAIVSTLPRLESLTVEDNHFSGGIQLNLGVLVSTLSLADNKLRTLSGISIVGGNVKSLVVKKNAISSIGASPPATQTLRSLDLSSNALHDWSQIDSIATAYPHLTSLRTTNTPLFAISPTQSATDAFMLTVARLPHLQTLNHSTISEKDRLNAEAFYLSHIGTELSRNAPEAEPQILARHPRYQALVAEYGPPTIKREPSSAETNPNALASRIVAVTFVFGNALAPFAPDGKKERTVRMLRSWDVYALYAFVARELRFTFQKPRMSMFDLTLVLENPDEDEDKDDVETVARLGGRGGKRAVDGDDEDGESSEDEDVAIDEKARLSRKFTAMPPSSRALATFFEGKEARIRVGWTGEKGGWG